MHAPQTIKPRPPPGQPGSQADPAMHHPAQPPCPRKRHQPNKQRKATARTAKRPHSTPSCTNIHASQAEKTEPSQAVVPPKANATATPHILPYIGRRTVKTTNSKHTPPTRNHPADRQTPLQHKAPGAGDWGLKV
ncbi:hypothetical protein CRENBAI_024811 [Crenichthys baileyi]|uniref:Uncharacterized protein n=1 Tax=Crenichthys baileyi TaxID=28760 RepID=A0AAV9REI8_9TELE